MSAGTVYLDGLSGNINVNVKAGEICGNIASKNVIAKLWAGDIHLAFDPEVKDLNANLRVILGDIRIKLPNCTKDQNNIKAKVTLGEIGRAHV